MFISNGTAPIEQGIGCLSPSPLFDFTIRIWFLSRVPAVMVVAARVLLPSSSRSGEWRGLETFRLGMVLFVADKLNLLGQWSLCKEGLFLLWDCHSINLLFSIKLVSLKGIRKGRGISTNYFTQKIPTEGTPRENSDRRNTICTVSFLICSITFRSCHTREWSRVLGDLDYEDFL